MIATKELRTDLLDRLKTEELVIAPASVAEYLELATYFPFKIEYHQSEIYTMGLASLIHEILSSMFGAILNNLYIDKDEFVVLGSNSGVQIQKFEGGYYMPDSMVLKGKAEFKQNSKSIITNPFIIVEVLSPATSRFDLNAKLPEYKHLESLNQIIFVSQDKIQVSSYLRSKEQANTWINQDFYELTDSVMVDGQPVSLASIYKKVKFD